MAVEIEDCYKILEIDEDASLVEIREAYRDLISIWHPDKYTHSQRLYEKALKKSKEINTAFETIRSHYSHSNEFTNGQIEYEDDEANFYLAVCPNCSVKNRVSKFAEKAGLVCGKCGHHLFKNSRTRRGSSGVEEISFGGGLFTLKGIEYKGIIVGYDNIKKCYYHNVRGSINGMPTGQDFSIKIKLWDGKTIKLKEGVDIRPAITKIPMRKIFNSAERKKKKQETLSEVGKVKTRFIYSLAFIKEFSKIEPKEESPWFY